jgi:hypothetical protein
MAPPCWLAAAISHSVCPDVTGWFIDKISEVIEGYRESGQYERRKGKGGENRNKGGYRLMISNA